MVEAKKCPTRRRQGKGIKVTEGMAINRDKSKTEITIHQYQ
jgi:hypothetical protein